MSYGTKNLAYEKRAKKTPRSCFEVFSVWRILVRKESIGFRSLRKLSKLKACGLLDFCSFVGRFPSEIRIVSTEMATCGGLAVDRAAQV